MRIKHKGAVPYGGEWIYTVPETKAVFKSYQFDQLLTQITKHRKAMGLHIGLGFEQEVEAQLCVTHPDECTELEPGEQPIESLTFADVLRGTAVLLSLKAAGGGLVDRSEANRRAEICASCRKNVTIRMPCSGGCPELKRLVNTIVGGSGTPFDAGLKGCAICHCDNKAHIWVPLEHLAKGVNDAMREQFKKVTRCWKQV